MYQIYKRTTVRLKKMASSQLSLAFSNTSPKHDLLLIFQLHYYFVIGMGDISYGICRNTVFLSTH